ncbi:DUF1778 domain-containing protein [Demequina pelophila]|uniref:type II toxin-antitoxin system TacA family antitoxin n=1 Tax=Demequina pelophila TaxID=1638984 RepID=UPI0007807266|nr:DUF1778 domain-containing protein [Demequina pelophila]
MAETKARINMRVSEQNLAIIRDAAAANGQDMTSFVLGAALERARAVLIESHVIRITPAEMERLESALDAEPREIPALRELLSRPAIAVGPRP